MNSKLFKSVLERQGLLAETNINPQITEWLETNGFFKAPASTRFHGTDEGDLYRHSELVARYLQEYTNRLCLKWTRPCSPYVVGLFHDLCKIDAYLPAGDSASGSWEYNKTQLLKGHGDKSVMLLSQFMTLTEEEMLCIRYHMGAYEKDDWEGYDLAIRRYPNVLYTHTADMAASKIDNT